MEGVLTGAALGILLIYMLDEAVAAVSAPRRGGAVEPADDLDLGPFRSNVGKIDIAPLEDLELGLVEAPRAAGIGSPSDPAAGAGGGGGAVPLSGGGGLSRSPRSAFASDPSPVEGSRPLSPPPVASGGGYALGALPMEQRIVEIIRIPQPPPIVPPTPPGPEPLIAKDLPEVMLVLVRSFSQNSGRSVEGKAFSDQLLNQHGVEYSRIDLRQADGVNFQILSERNLQGSGGSDLDDATLKMIAFNANLVASQLIGGPEGDTFVLSTRDLINLGLMSNGTATASLQSFSGSLVDSGIEDEGGNNLVKLQANTQLTFLALGESERASLAFDLLTQAMRNSWIDLGSGDDSVTVISGFHTGEGSVGISSALTTSLNSAGQIEPGIRFELPEQLAQLPVNDAWSFQFKATAIGLQDSAISTGAGNDEVIVFTRIDQSLGADLGELLSASGTQIEQQRIGMLRSSIDVGAGSDVVKVNGDVIDSVINLGDGNNILILEGAMLGNSRILSGNGQNRIEIVGSLGGDLVGGAGDDTFTLNALGLVGRLDGGPGNDTLRSTTRYQRDLALIQGPNQGVIGGLQFSSIEGLDLGGGDDVVLMSLEGTLTGQLLGGDGLDRLEFNNWELPVTVDLDLGSATAVYGGANGGLRGFEQVFGGIGNDRLAASGRFSGIDGREGDDVLFLRWSPWLSPAGQELDLRGGGGNDLFVLVGLENPIPPEWDGVSGTPRLLDLHLERFTSANAGDNLGWLRQVSNEDGTTRQDFTQLTPSGPEGLGNATLLPIAPLEQLLSGMSTTSTQLAIAWEGRQSQSPWAELRLLGSEGPGTSRLIAYLPMDAQIPERELNTHS